MQSLEEAAKAAEGCVLGEAERRMNAGDELVEERVPMVCSTCSHFHHLERNEDKWAIVDVLPEGFENRMNFSRMVASSMGVCDLRLDASEGMLFDECFGGCDPDNGYEEAL